MVINRKISSRYALSLLDLTEEKTSLDVIYSDAGTIISALEVSAPLRKLLVNPVIKADLKMSVLDEIFSKKVSPDMARFMRFLVEKNRETYLYGIMKRFIELRNEKLGVADVEVKTAVEFTNGQRNSLVEKLEAILNKKVNVNFVIDKELLGGFIARVEDTLYDGSIKNQLINLKKQLLQGSTF